MAEKSWTVLDRLSNQKTGKHEAFVLGDPPDDLLDSVSEEALLFALFAQGASGSRIPARRLWRSIESKALGQPKRARWLRLGWIAPAVAAAVALLIVTVVQPPAHRDKGTGQRVSERGLILIPAASVEGHRVVAGEKGALMLFQVRLDQPAHVAIYQLSSDHRVAKIYRSSGPILPRWDQPLRTGGGDSYVAYRRDPTEQETRFVLLVAEDAASLDSVDAGHIGTWIRTNSTRSKGITIHHASHRW